MDNRVTLLWPGGEHAFALDLGGLRALQAKCDAGPEQIFLRLATPGGGWRVDDVYQTLRIGLMGGGMGDGEATATVRRALDTSPLADLRAPAAEVLSAALYGVEDDQPGKPEGEAPSPPESGDGPTSTAPAP